MPALDAPERNVIMVTSFP